MDHANSILSWINNNWRKHWIAWMTDELKYILGVEWKAVSATETFYSNYFSSLYVKRLSKKFQQPEVEQTNAWPPASSRSWSRLPFPVPASRCHRRRRCRRRSAPCRSWPKPDPELASSQVWEESPRSRTSPSRRLGFKMLGWEVGGEKCYGGFFWQYWYH